jgi:hypothetical protein
MNFATECTSALVHGGLLGLWQHRNYTFRSMPRSSATRAQPEHARETSGARGRKPATHAWTKRLTRRVVQKPDGRYLIYFEKI